MFFYLNFVDVALIYICTYSVLIHRFLYVLVGYTEHCYRAAFAAPDPGYPRTDLREYPFLRLRPPRIPILASPVSGYAHSCISGLRVSPFLRLQPLGILILASPASGNAHSHGSGLRVSPFSWAWPPGILILAAPVPRYSHAPGPGPRVFSFLRLRPTGIHIFEAPAHGYSHSRSSVSPPQSMHSSVIIKFDI